MNGNYKHAGFTLIEVMLAMTLLSIMVVLLFSSLRIGAESWNKGESKIAQVNQKAVVYQFFKRHLPSIPLLWDDFSEGQRQFTFQGERNKLQFVSTFPASSGRKGLQRFEIVFDKSEQGIIKIMLKPFFPTIDGEDWQVEEVILLENVENFELAYFGKESNDSDEIWHDSWQEKQNLPALLKIKIALADQSYWPEMVFALKLASKQFNGVSDNKKRSPFSLQ